MITPHRLEKVDNFFSRFFEDAILHDLEIMKDVEEGLNFVIVVAVLNAVNLLGNLFLGEISNNAIEAFINEFFPSKYKTHAPTLAKFFRNSLIHVAYTPRGTGVSRRRPDLHLKVRLTPEGYAYIIDSDELYDDFKEALASYKEKVKQDEPTLEKFETFLDKIEGHFFEDLKPRFKEDTTKTAMISNATYCPYPQYFDIEEEE